MAGGKVKLLEAGLTYKRWRLEGGYHVTWYKYILSGGRYVTDPHYDLSDPEGVRLGSFNLMADALMGYLRDKKRASKC